jgi:hypothetical protein
MALFRFILKHEHAVESHKPFYNNDDFEVVLMKRLNYFDIFPLNVFIAYADPPFTSEWDGIISTDGKKIVITQSKWRRADQHKKIFEYSLDEIDSMSSNHYFLNLTLKNHAKGLTMSKGNYFLKYLIFFGTLTFAMMFQTYLFKGKIAKISLENDFKNRDKFISLLKHKFDS